MAIIMKTVGGEELAVERVVTGEEIIASARLYYVTHKKSKVIALLLWFFLGFIGAHSFYMKQEAHGALKALSVFLLFFFSQVGAVAFTLFTVMLVWWLIDLFLIGKTVDIFNEKLKQRLGFYEPRDNVF